MSALRDRNTQTAQPTAEDPAIVDLGNGNVVLSRVALWFEDGQCIIRSLEYDVIAAGDDVEQAVGLFVHRTVDYANLLWEADDRTDVDMELVHTIHSRLSQIAAEISEIDSPGRTGGPPRRIRRYRGHRTAAPRWHLHRVAQS